MPAPKQRKRRRKLRPAAYLILAALLAIVVGIPLLLFRTPAPGPETKDKENATSPQDTPVPEITAPAEWTIAAGDAFDPLQGVSAADETGQTYQVSVEGSYDLTRPGTYPLTFVALDRKGERHTKTAVLTVTASPFDENGKMVDGSYKTSKGFDLIIKDGIAYVDGYMLVNKSYSVPSGFSSIGDGTRTMREEAANAFAAMKAGAPAEVSAYMTIRSGVRNIADQTVIFNNYVQSDGMVNALTYSARPGHSEHHTGLAMDITTSSSADCERPEIAAVMDWMKANAWQYGFILRYPENKTDETGYIYEPWHYRWVGVELAQKLYNGGDWITMEDYFGVDSEYKY